MKNRDKDRDDYFEQYAPVSKEEKGFKFGKAKKTERLDITIVNTRIMFEQSETFFKKTNQNQR